MDMEVQTAAAQAQGFVNLVQISGQAQYSGELPGVGVLPGVALC